MKFRLLLAALGVGAALVYHGWQELALSRGATLQPVSVSLTGIEAGAVPANPHVAIGPHWRMYQELVFSYRTGRGKRDAEPGPEQRVDYVYYPIVARDNAFFREVARLEALHGGLDRIPGDAWPQHVDFAVLVRSQEFPTLEALPEAAWTASEGAAGMVVNEVRSLSRDERVLISESFPGVALDQLLILELGRAPTPATTSYAFMGGGAFVAALPLLVLARRGRAREDALAAPSGVEGGGIEGGGIEGATGPPRA